MRFRSGRQSNDERQAAEDCRHICLKAFQVIRASAYTKQAVDAPESFEGDYAEWIRLVADLCDGLAWPRPTAVESLAYRRQEWNDTQTNWVENVLSSA